MPQSVVMEAMSFDSQPTTPPPADSEMTEATAPVVIQLGGTQQGAIEVETAKVAEADSADELVVVTDSTAKAGPVEPTAAEPSTAPEQPKVCKQIVAEPVASDKSIRQVASEMLSRVQRSKGPKPPRAPGPSLAVQAKRLKRK